MKSNNIIKSFMQCYRLIIINIIININSQINLGYIIIFILLIHII